MSKIIRFYGWEKIGFSVIDMNSRCPSCDKLNNIIKAELKITCECGQELVQAIGDGMVQMWAKPEDLRK